VFVSEKCFGTFGFEKKRKGRSAGKHHLTELEKAVLIFNNFTIPHPFICTYRNPDLKNRPLRGRLSKGLQAILARGGGWLSFRSSATIR